jgi:hypothetical protein
MRADRQVKRVRLLYGGFRQNRPGGVDGVVVAAGDGANYRELPVTIWYDIKALISDLFH